eukprot:s588_g14.t1
MREPAVFRLEKKFSGAQMGKTGGSSTEWSPVYVVKLFDTGMSAMGRFPGGATVAVLEPGPLGVGVDPKTGDVLKVVAGSIGDAAGVRPGYVFETLEGRPYGIRHLQALMNGTKPYNATLGLVPRGETSQMWWCSDNAWLSDGRYLQMEMSEQFVDDFDFYHFFGRTPEDGHRGRHDGSIFIRHVSQNFRLTQSTLPPWWLSRFQEASDPRSLHADAMMGCRISTYQNGTCYKTWIGHKVQIFKAEEAHCKDDLDVKEGEMYTYEYSDAGTQTYVSTSSCLPLAAHHELQLEIAELREHQMMVVATMATPCRTSLRFVLDVAHLPCKESTFGYAWNLEKMYGL